MDRSALPAELEELIAEEPAERTTPAVSLVGCVSSSFLLVAALRTLAAWIGLHVERNATWAKRRHGGGVQRYSRGRWADSPAR